MSTSTVASAEAASQPATVTVLSTEPASGIAVTSSLVTASQVPGSGSGSGSGSGAEPSVTTFSSTLGEPDPGLPTTPSEPPATSASPTGAGVASGLAAR